MVDQRLVLRCSIDVVLCRRRLCRSLAVVNFRRTPPPRNYLSRREQWRLLLLVMSLGLIVLLMSEARDPANWQWFFALDNGAAAGPADGPAIDNRLAPETAEEGVPGAFVSPAAAGARQQTSGRFPDVPPKLLETVRDDAPFRHDEQEAWFHLLGILQKTDEATLGKASIGRVTFAQLYNQSSEYRGELVTVRGTIRRAHLLKAPKNDRGIDQYYQTWLQPADNRTMPMVIYCLSLPQGFPTGMDVSAEVEITGFYFKRWVYKAQDAIRTTPTLLARTVDWQKDATASAPGFEQAAWPESPAAGTDEGPGFGPEEVVDVEPAADAIAGPRDLLERHGVDQSHFEKLTDGRPIDDNETEVLLKVMYWVRDFRTADVARWAQDEPDPVELARNPEPARGQIFSLSGRITQVEPLQPLPEMVERLRMEAYYRCELLLDGQQPVVVYALDVPQAWRQGGAIDEPASARGLFLKLTDDDPQRPMPMFVARRIAWHPDTVLGNLGMDVGLFDGVQNRKRLLGAEREAFYQMLDAVGRAEPGELLRLADDELRRTGKDRFSVVPLFMEPESQHGQLVALSGTVRRVVPIRVKEPDVVERFGIDHYYELALFTDDSEDNPLFFCVRELPEGMPIGEGADFGEHVRVAGFFFKLRLYPLELPDAEGPARRGQLAPLLFGREPVWYPQQKPATNTMFQAIAGGLFVLVLLGIWLGLWRYGRGDKQFHDQTLVKAHGSDSGIALDKIDLTGDGTPDFSRLEEMDRGRGEE